MRLSHLAAAATLVALLGAMLVVMQPASAHDLGTCSDPEYLTAAKCRMMVAVDDDDDDSTADQVSEDGSAPDNNDPWTAGTHTAANHPPTLGIVVLDSDGIVPDDSTVTVMIVMSGVFATDPRPDLNNGVRAATLSRAVATEDDGDGGTVATTTLQYVRVSGELEGVAAPRLMQTSNLDDDMSANRAFAMIDIPAGTTPGTYTVSTKLAAGMYYDYSGNEMTAKSARATFTVGDAGLGLSSAALSLGNRVPDDPTTLTDETKPESGSDSATGNGINLVVTASNSLDNKADSSSIDQITVIAPGGDITINAAMVDDPDDTTAPHAKVALFSATTEDNSSSLDEDVTRGAGSNNSPLTGDAIRQAMSINVNKADDQPGTVDVYVILSGKGAAISNTVTLTFTGPNDALSIGEPSDSLLAFTEVTTLPEVLRRDIISFDLGALDAGGNAGPVPDVRVRILNPDGKVVNEDSIDVEQGPNSKKVPNAKLTLTSLNDALTPLDAGTYTVKITSAGGLSASGEFMVVGRADGVEVTVDTNDPSAVGEIITATATVTADGETVPNGTIVTFNANDVAGDGDSVLVAVGSGAVQRTIGGTATASFVAVGPGSSVVSATAHRTTAVQVIASTAGMTEPEAMPEEEASVSCLSELSGFSTWTCGVDSSASEVFELVADRGKSAIHLWNGSAWVRYSVVDDAMVPGSSDFMVTENDILYISD